VGEATGVREGVEPHPGTPLGRYLRAIAQTVRGRIVPSPEPPFFRSLRLPKKRARKKGANKLLDKDVHSGYAEGKALGVGRGLCHILAKPRGLGRKLSVYLTGMCIRGVREHTPW